MNWRIHYYETSSGRKPTKIFISRLKPTAVAKVGRSIELLREFGPELGLPYAKKIGTDLYELRILGKDSLRIFYAFDFGNKQAILLHAAKKKSNKLAQNDIKLATQRLKTLTFV